MERDRKRKAPEHNRASKKQKVSPSENQNGHPDSIRVPQQNEFDSIIPSQQRIIRTSRGRVHNIMPIVNECKHTDHNNATTCYYIFGPATISARNTGPTAGNFLDVAIPVPRCTFAIKRSIPDSMAHILQRKMRYLETNPLFRDYRYPARNNEVVQKALVLQKQEHNQHTSGSRRRFYNYYTNDEMKVFETNATQIQLPSDTLNKCIQYGVSVKEYERYLYSTSVTKKQWLQLSNMVEEDDEEYRKWGVRIQDIIDPTLNCQSNTLIPALFAIDEDYEVKITSDINNLSRLLFGEMYDVLEKVFKYMVPMFEYILPAQTLRNRTLKVCVKSQIYELNAGKIYSGNTHREGFDRENIAAVGIYYFDKDDAFNEDVFELGKEFTLGGACGGSVKAYLKTELNIKQNDCVVFNNKNGIVHRLKTLQNGSSCTSAKRKILAFFVVDPLDDRVITSKDICVNVWDKSEFIVSNMCRQELIRDVSAEVVKIIVSFLYKMSLFEQRSTRNRERMNRTIPRPKMQTRRSD
eukprot:989716_1